MTGEGEVFEKKKETTCPRKEIATAETESSSPIEKTTAVAIVNGGIITASSICTEEC